jgi:hypothetical protein
MQNSEGNPIVIEDPEISKAYYGELKGSSDYYKIVSDKPFSLYLNILVPDIPVENERRFSVEVKDIAGKQILFIDGTDSTWEKFYEPFGGDNYLQGPETRLNVSQGTYHIRVFNSNNVGKYSLAVGEIESFPPIEVLKTIFILPLLKQEFFNQSLLVSFLNIAGLSILIIFAVITVSVILVLRRLRK